jgi:hypothetical protein
METNTMLATDDGKSIVNRDYHKISNIDLLIKEGYLIVTEEKEVAGKLWRTIDFLSQTAKEAYLENLARICVQNKNFLKTETERQNIIKTLLKKDTEGLKALAIKLFADIFLYCNLPMKNRHYLQLLAIIIYGYIDWINYIEKKKKTI